MISLYHITKDFDKKQVLRSVDFDVKRGEISALIGPNGAGKTTTLRCIYGDLTPKSGTVQIDERDFHPSMKSRIAVTSEDRVSFKDFSVKDYADLYKNIYPHWDQEHFDTLIKKYNFKHSDIVEKYSMGMKTLLVNLLTFSTNADIAILDEPVQHLDPLIRSDVSEMIKSYINEDRTIIISSHEIYEVEEVATHCSIMKYGRIIYSNEIDEAKNEHRIAPEGVGESSLLVGKAGPEFLYKTTDDIGKYPTLKDIALGYLNGDF